jgi:sec-independent protein translocase protein TatA
MGPLGVPEMIFIFVLALLILGPKKLPEIGRTIGKGMAEFRRASKELKSTFEREMNALERENESVKEVTSSYTSSVASTSTAAATSAPYDYPYDDYYSHDSASHDGSQEAAPGDNHSQESTPSVSATQAAEAQPAPANGAAPEHGKEVKS